MSVRHRLISLFIWAQILLVSAVVVTGGLYVVALLLGSGSIPELVQFPAQTFSAALFALIALLWLIGLTIRFTLGILFRKKTVGLDLKQRLGRIGP